MIRPQLCFKHVLEGQETNMSKHCWCVYIPLSVCFDTGPFAKVTALQAKF